VRGMSERWLPVPGYDGWYDVSDEGRVRSWRNGRWPTRRAAPFLVVGTIDKGGYRRVCLQKSGRDSAQRIHRLVLAAFVGSCPPGREAGHLNGIPHDNRASNLAWVTKAENEAHRKRDGGVPQGERNPSAVLAETQVQSIRARAGSVTQEVLSAEYGVHQSTISNIITGKRWAHVA
jgi:hypothetical protein